MLYNNLLYFLVAIFIFSTNSPPDAPGIAPLWAALVLTVTAALFFLLAGRMFAARRAGSDHYFATEKRLSILAVLLFVFYVYGLDLKYYFKPLSIGGKLPALSDIAGLFSFFLLLCAVWVQARPAYENLFQRRYTPVAFVFSNIKANLPIVLPWLALTLVFDLLALIPVQGFAEILRPPWGDLVLFAFFVLFLVLFLPPLVRKLWGCTPLAPGPLRDRMVRFCQAQGFHSEILSWPLFEGQVLTAGIMGIVPKLRYLLVTPALLATLDGEELDSVLAHEIGHVKRLHLVLYITLFFGFSVLAGTLAEPLPHLVLSSDFFYWLLANLSVSPESLLGITSAVPILVMMVLYFRFVFGYFIRNFERQADLYVFQAQGTGAPLISSFEKIAGPGGVSREERNWHHFGIGERIDFLRKCEHDRGHIRRHDRKLRHSLLFYFLCIAALVLALRQIETESLYQGYEIRYAEAVLLQKARQDPSNSLWPVLLGNFLQSRNLEKKAVEAYEKALLLQPMNPEVNNNLAWLLLTAQEGATRDAKRALTLARTAILVQERGYILDTLATAYWANGLVAEAVATEKRAMRIDPNNRAFYLAQIEKFQQRKWSERGD